MITVVNERQTQIPLWQWQNWQGLPYLTCQLLQNWQHGFFTQAFYPLSPEEFFQALQSDASVYRVKQVHGNCVLTPSEIEANVRDNISVENNFAQADAIITEQPHQSIWVASADCTPVLIGDSQTGRVSAIHAGWRGTAKRIVPIAIERFLAFGSALENLCIVLGPAIAGEVYQVTEYVAAEVGKSLVFEEKIDAEAEILANLRYLNLSPLSSDSTPGRVRLDVRRVLWHQLKQLGIKDEQIAIAPYCTYQQPEYFFSYRRTKEKKFNGQEL